MKRGDVIKAVITIAKVRQGVPTVVMIAGHRYVLDPNTKTKEVEWEWGLHQNKKRV